MGKKFPIFAVVLLSSVFFLGSQTTPVPEEVSVMAVMPFRSVGDTSQGPLGESFSESLTTKLVGLPGLKVMERTQIGRITSELGLQRDAADLFNPETLARKGALVAVDYQVVGLVTLAGNRFTVDMRMIHVRDGLAMLARHLEGSYPSDFFRTQDRLALEVVQTLKIKLTELEKQRISRQATQDLKAFELFNLSLGAKSNSERIPLLVKALERDPTYLDAAHLLADLYRESGDTKSAINTYLSILKQDPRDQRSLFNCSLLSFDGMDMTSAVDLMTALRDLKPQDADVYYHLGLFSEYGTDGVRQSPGSDMPKAYKNYLKALEFDPNHLKALEGAGLLAAYLGETEHGQGGDPKTVLGFLDTSAELLRRLKLLAPESDVLSQVDTTLEQVLGAQKSLNDYLERSNQ